MCERELLCQQIRKLLKKIYFVHMGSERIICLYLNYVFGHLCLCVFVCVSLSISRVKEEDIWTVEPSEADISP